MDFHQLVSQCVKPKPVFTSAAAWEGLAVPDIPCRHYLGGHRRDQYLELALAHQGLGFRTSAKA